MGAVDLEGYEVVAINPRHPAHIDVRDDATHQLESGICGIVRGRLILLAALVVALDNIGVASADHALDLAEEIVEHVAPVADHVQDDAAAVLLAIVPGRPLRFLPIALEHPISELATDREHA